MAILCTEESFVSPYVYGASFKSLKGFCAFPDAKYNVHPFKTICLGV